MNIFISGFNDIVPLYCIVVNTTSKSNNWSKELSPFFLGPVQLHNKDDWAKNVENAWQFSKVYPEHDLDTMPFYHYYNWATDGWNDTWAHRYPMGKGKTPLYSLWGDERLSYIEARKKIYIPLYCKAAIKTKAFVKLKEILLGEKDLYLIDYDGYNHKKLGMSYLDVVNCETKKMGHAFVLGMMLEKVVDEKGNLIF